MTRKKRTDLAAIADDALYTDTPPVAPASGPPARKGYNKLLPVPVYEQLRTLAFEERRSISKLLDEGIDAVFKARGLPSIRELTQK